MTRAILISEPEALNVGGRRAPTPLWGPAAPISRDARPVCVRIAPCGGTNRHTQPLGPCKSRGRTGYSIRCRAQTHAIRAPIAHEIARAREAHAPAAPIRH